MVVGMPGTEAEMEAQQIEGGVGLEVIQDEEQLLLEGVEVAFWPARRDLFDFAALEPFQLDSIVGDSEGCGEDGCGGQQKAQRRAPDLRRGDLRFPAPLPQGEEPLSPCWPRALRPDAF